MYECLKLSELLIVVTLSFNYSKAVKFILFFCSTGLKSTRLNYVKSKECVQFGLCFFNDFHLPKTHGLRRIEFILNHFQYLNSIPLIMTLMQSLRTLMINDHTCRTQSAKSEQSLIALSHTEFPECYVQVLLQMKYQTNKYVLK